MDNKEINIMFEPVIKAYNALCDKFENIFSVKTPNEENDKSARHKELLEELHETYLSKNADYGDSFSRSYEKYGVVAPMVRISDKFNRLEHLIENKQQVKDESLRDTALDMANYCLMFVMELEEE